MGVAEPEAKEEDGDFVLPADAPPSSPTSKEPPSSPTSKEPPTELAKNHANAKTFAAKTVENMTVSTFNYPNNLKF